MTSSFNGTSVPKIATSGAVKEAGIRGVQIGPGLTAFTRIFWSAKESARDFVKVKIAPLVAE